MVQDDAQQTPPRTVIFEETVRNTLVQERVCLKNSEKREAQRTKPAKERLGTKPSDFCPARDCLGDAGPSNQQFIQRQGKMSFEKRDAQHKSRPTRDTARSHQRLPRAAKSYPIPEPEQTRSGDSFSTTCRNFRFRGQTHGVLWIQRIKPQISTNFYLPCVTCKRHRNLLTFPWALGQR